eukprot:scaffold137886_cov37-Tisochrysis_lutea.AAC.2
MNTDFGGDVEALRAPMRGVDQGCAAYASMGHGLATRGSSIPSQAASGAPIDFKARHCRKVGSADRSQAVADRQEGQTQPRRETSRCMHSPR